MSLRSGFKITARDLRIAKLGKKTGNAKCGRELEAYLNAIGRLGSETKIPMDIVTALTGCINAKVSDFSDINRNDIHLYSDQYVFCVYIGLVQCV